MAQQRRSPALAIGMILVIFFVAGAVIGYNAGQDSAAKTCVPANK